MQVNHAWFRGFAYRHIVWKDVIALGRIDRGLDIMRACRERYIRRGRPFVDVARGTIPYDSIDYIAA